MIVYIINLCKISICSIALWDRLGGRFQFCFRFWSELNRSLIQNRLMSMCALHTSNGCNFFAFLTSWQFLSAECCTSCAVRYYIVINMPSQILT